MPEEMLYVVTSIFNPENNEIRYKLYRDFEIYMKSFPNVILYTIELAIGDQDFHVTNEDNIHNIQIRSNEVMFFKENLTNIVFKKLPLDAKVAWIDGDVSFTNVNWVDDTLLMLDGYKFLQLMDTVDSLGPKGEVIQPGKSFVYNWIHDLATVKNRGRSGGAWASTIKTLQDIDFLLDWDITGSSDWVAAFGLTNQIPTKITTHKLLKKNSIWLDKVKAVVNGNVSYVPGTLLHYFHGWPKDRGYGTRDRVLMDNDFDPYTDIAYRDDGLMYFSSNKPGLRQGMIDYFKLRNEHGG